MYISLVLYFEVDSCVLLENDLLAGQNESEKQNLATVPKTFVGTEVFEGKAVVLYLICSWISIAWLKILLFLFS